jgi:deaminated glutathione amidase
MLKLYTQITKKLIEKTMAEFASGSSSSSKVKIALGQLSSTNDREKNFAQCSDFIRQASENSAKMIFLPENFNWLTTVQGETGKILERIPEGSYVQKYCELAKKYNIYLSLGGFQEKIDDEKNRMANTHIVIDNQGAIASLYRKIHLFDINIDEVNKYMESSYVRPGDKIIPPVDTPVGKLGLSICYDLRFPELYRSLSDQGAEVLAIPAAFLHKTGEVNLINLF